MAATNRPESVDLALRRPGRFDKEFEIGAPSPAARRSMLHSLLSRMSHDISERQVHDVADSLHGFVAADIAAVCQEAALIVLRRLAGGGGLEGRSIQLDLAALKEAATIVRPSGMREVAIEVNKVLETETCPP
jgi:SpoVK/Ycf46/Vps4 family AAA+-type ATPase